MAEPTALEDIFTPPADDATETDATDTPAEEPATDEPEGEEAAADAQDAGDDGKAEAGLTRALQEERTKRQALEDRQRTLEQQLAALNAKPTEPEPEPSYFDDDAELIEAGQANAALRKQRDDLRAEMKAEAQNLRYAIQEEVIRDAHPDFDDKLNAFEQAAAKDAGLIEQARAAANPFRFIYQKAKALQEMAPYDGDPAKMRAAIEKEVEAKYQSKLKELERSKVPGSATAGAIGGDADKRATSGQTPLKEILGGR